MTEKKSFEQVLGEGEKYFMICGEKLVEVGIFNIGYDYAEVEIIDPDESPEVMELKGKRWIIYFSNLMIRKRV